MYLPLYVARDFLAENTVHEVHHLADPEGDPYDEPFADDVLGAAREVEANRHAPGILVEEHLGNALDEKKEVVDPNLCI